MSSRTVIKNLSVTRLTWSHIKEMYPGEWVELIDVQWDWQKPTPSSGQVRNHAADRSELMKMVQASGPHPEAVVLYVGAAPAVVERDARLEAL